MQIKYDFSELINFAERLSSSDLEKTFKRIAQDIAKALLVQMRTFTPRETGQLINGWDGNAFLVLPVKGGYKVEIVNKAEYAAWVNDGHRVRNQADGEYLKVHHRVKVPVASQWQTPVNDYYVFGHFFVEKGILQIKNSTEIEQIIMRELTKWWDSV